MKQICTQGKLLLAMLLVLAMMTVVVSISPITANAATYDDLTYTVSNGEVTIIGCTPGASGALVIPETINGYPVTGIGHAAFYNCTSLQSITIGDSVTSIDSGAFCECTNLRSVTIGDGVTTIGNEAFWNCTSLTSITIGDSVTYIGEWAFINCNSLTSVTIPDSVTYIGTWAFRGCTSLQSVTIGDSVTYIGDGAFDGCSNLASIYISDIAAWCNIDFGEFGFDEYSCGNPLVNGADLYLNGELVKDLTIPDSVTTIGAQAFTYCTSLQSVTIPDSVTEIGEGVFSGCTSLTSVTIGNSVTRISNDAFYDCTSLTSITIPDSVTAIGEWTFSGCTSLQSITIPDSVTGIGWNAFSGCTSLTDVYYTGSEEFWKAVSISTSNEALTGATMHYHEHTYQDGVCTDCSAVEFLRYSISTDRKITITGYTGIKTALSIPAAIGGLPVTAIAASAFKNCTSLRSVTIPDSVTTIGEYAFQGCSALTQIRIPSAVTSINGTAFWSCRALTGIVVDENNATYASDDRGALFTKDMTQLITVPGGITGVYVIPSGVTQIRSYAFYNCDVLQSVTVPVGVTAISDNTFYGCNMLKDIILPVGVTSIGYRAFYYSGSLKDIELPAGVETISANAFENCGNLASITCPVSITGIGGSAFANCTKLKDVYYAGTATQWSSIEIGGDNLELSAATVHYSHIHDYTLLDPVKVPATCTQDGYTKYTCIYGDEKQTDVVPALGHQPGINPVVTAPTCTEEGYTGTTCPRCQQTLKTDITPALGHNVVVVPVKAATCTEQGISKAGTQCSRCLVYLVQPTWTDPLGHSYGAWSKISDTQHSRTCSVCQNVETAAHIWDSGAVTKPASCKEPGIKTFTCTVCNGTRTEDIPKTDDHIYGSWTKVNDTQHKRTCTVCQKEETAAHTWDSGAVTKPTSCKEPGIKTFTCTVCNGTRTEDIPKIDDHIYGSWTKVNDTQHKRTCTVCQKEETAAHTWDSGAVTKPTSCKEPGIKTFTCTVCNGTRTEDIPKTDDHIYGSWIKVNDAQHKHTCTVCLKEETAAHTWDSGTVIKPTYTKQGYTLYTCICGDDYHDNYTDAKGLPAPQIAAKTVTYSGRQVLSWTDDGEASGYYIYRATKKTGSYTKVGTVENTTWQDTSASIGKTYYYKVVAYYVADSTLNSGYSNIVSMTAKCDAPIISVENNSSGKPAISWAKVSGAKKYTVYRATSENGKYSKLGTTSKLTYTDSNAKSGTTYFYKVIANASSSKYNSGYSNVVSCGVICGTPSVTVKIDANTGKPGLSWKKVDGAARYAIYRKLPGDADFMLLAEQTAVTYADKTAPIDTKCEYYVQALGKTESLNGAASKVVSATSGIAKPVLTGSINGVTGKPVITWQAVEGAVKYEIYRSTKSSKSYKLVATVEELTYTDETVSAGKTYYYKVKAIGEVSKSADSSYVKLTGKCATPEISVTNDAKGKPYITWTKVSGAKKYTVYRATSETGKYTKLGTTTKAYYTDSKASAGKTYFYKIIANASSSKNNSPYSNIVSCGVNCATPVVKVTTNASGQPVLSWSKVSGAAKYEIYLLGAEDYVTLSTVTGTSWTDAECAVGEGRYYGVRAIAAEEAYNSEVSEPVFGRGTCATPKPTGKVGENKKPVISWGEVEGAVKYEIYRSTSKSKGYKAIGEAEALTYEDLTAKKGKTYYYKVVAVGENCESAQSGYVKVKSK